MGTILLIVLILLLVGALPTWPYSSGWGYYPTGGLGLVFIIILILVLMEEFSLVISGRGECSPAPLPASGLFCSQLPLREPGAKPSRNPRLNSSALCLEIIHKNATGLTLFRGKDVPRSPGDFFEQDFVGFEFSARLGFTNELGISDCMVES